MKYTKLFKAIWHSIFCGFSDIVIEHEGKANEWIPVTKIYCEKCEKIFYKIETT